MSFATLSNYLNGLTLYITIHDRRRFGRRSRIRGLLRTDRHKQLHFLEEGKK